MLCGENLDERFGLVQKRLDLLAALSNGTRWIETQPAARFANLFQANPKLVNEILARLCALEFTMIRQRRSAAVAAIDPRHAVPALVAGNASDKSNDSDRVFEQIVLQDRSVSPTMARFPPELNVER